MTTPSARLIALHDALAEAVALLDENRVDDALTAIDEHLRGQDDPDAAFWQFDALVDARVQQLADSDMVDLADLHATCVQDYYEAVGMTGAIAWRELDRGRIMLDAGRAAEALELLRSADEQFAAEGERSAFQTYLLGLALLESDDAAAAEARLVAARAMADGELAVVGRGTAPGAAEVAKLHVDAALIESALGDLYGRQANYAASAVDHVAAAEHWLAAGELDQAAQSRISAGLGDLMVASLAMHETRFEDAEEPARRAYAIGVQFDRQLRAMAAVPLAGALASRGEVTEALPLLEFALAELSPQQDSTLVAQATHTLGLVHVMRSDLVAAYQHLNKAVQLARSAGMDDLAEQALQSLDALSDGRGGQPTAAQNPALRRHFDDPFLDLVPLRAALLTAVSSGRSDEARALAHELIEKAKALPASEDLQVNVHGLLHHLERLEGNPVAARAHLDAAGRIVADLRRGRRSGIAVRLEPFLELWRGFAALAEGREGDFFDAALAARDRFLSTGATVLAARAAAGAGAVEFQRGNARAAARHVIPAALVLATVRLVFPSSAERAAFSASLGVITELAFRVAAATGDGVLLAELIEVLRAQSMPSIHDGTEAQPRSLDVLLRALTDELANPSLAAAVETQETSLDVPARIRMPWGTVALAPLFGGVWSHVLDVGPAPTVPLRVPR